MSRHRRQLNRRHIHRREQDARYFRELCERANVDWNRADREASVWGAKFSRFPMLVSTKLLRKITEYCYHHASS